MVADTLGGSGQRPSQTRGPTPWPDPRSWLGYAVPRGSGQRVGVRGGPTPSRSGSDQNVTRPDGVVSSSTTTSSSAAARFIVRSEIPALAPAGLHLGGEPAPLRELGQDQRLGLGSASRAATAARARPRGRRRRRPRGRRAVSDGDRARPPSRTSTVSTPPALDRRERRRSSTCGARPAGAQSGSAGSRVTVSDEPRRVVERGRRR